MRLGTTSPSIDCVDFGNTSTTEKDAGNVLEAKCDNFGEGKRPTVTFGED